MKQKIFKSLLLACILFAFVPELVAQNEKKEKLGPASDFIKQLKEAGISNAENSNINGRLEKISVKLDKEGDKTSNIKHFNTIGNLEIYSGKLIKEENSSVVIEVSGNNVTGSIIQYKENKAFKYSTEADGIVTLKEVDIDSVICTEFSKVLTPGEAVGTGSGTTTTTAVTEVPIYHSNIDAPATIYLDFDGEYTNTPRWGIIDAQPSGFTSNDIYIAWSIVAEDFAPFNVNVTTSRSYYDSKPFGAKHMNIFTPTTTAAPGWGGVADIGSFSYPYFCPSWSFNFGGKSGGETASHEIGHALGLHHDGLVNPYSEYYGGHNKWGPIMGAVFSRDLVQWSKGEYQSASNNFQDDLSVITRPLNNMGYRPDDYGNLHTSPFVFDYYRSISNTGLIIRSGVISKTSDVDVFRFDTDGGNVSFYIYGKDTVSGYPISNLDIKAELLNASGSVIATFNPAGLNVSINQNVSAGTYYLRIDGTGEGNPLTDGYSDYGSLGTYEIRGQVTAPRTNQFVANVAYPENGSVLVNPTSVKIRPYLYSSYSSPVTKVEYFLGTVKLGESNGTSIEHFLNYNFPDGQHTIWVRATNTNGQVVTSTSITFTVYKNLTPEPVTPMEYGLVYVYYEGIFTTLPNFSSLSSLYSGISQSVTLEYIPKRADNFALRFTGYIQVETETLYRFTLNSDDGSKLYIGNKLIINNDGSHAMRELEGFAALAVGVYPITVEYFEATGGQDLIFNSYYAGDNSSTAYLPLMRKIGATQQSFNLSYGVTQGIKYEYNEGTYDVLPTNFNSLTYKSTGALSNYSLSIPNRRADYFAVRFSGYIDVKHRGEYRFFTKSDDGSKLYIGDKLVVANDGLHDMSLEKTGVIWLEPGKHKIKTEYFEKTGGEGLSISYSGPGVYKNVIPNNVLFRDPLPGEQIAYTLYEQTIPGVIYAENYDHGGEGIAYHDKTAGNQFGLFRNDGVDITEYYSSRASNYWISNIVDGEWVEYTVRATKSGNMNIRITSTSGNGTSRLHIQKNNVAITPSVTIPAITNGAPYQEVAINNIYFTEGVQVLKVFFDKGGFMFDQLNIQDVISTRQGVIDNDNLTTLSAKNILAFPNPFDESLSFDLSAFNQVDKIKILNGNGTTQWESNDVDLLNGIFTLTGKLTSGMYIVEINADQGMYHTMVIKK